jgi:hypothetical protein
VKPQAPPLASAEELCAIAERALELLDHLAENPVPWAKDPVTRAELHRHYELERCAFEALRFCAAAAAVIKAPGLAPMLAVVMDDAAEADRHAEGDLSVLTGGLEAALRAGGRLDAVEDLLDHAAPSVRRAVAAGLRVQGREERAALEKLARDRDPEVRGAARATLGDVPWWMGKWSRDPLSLLDHGEAERHRAALEELSALCDQRRWKLTAEDETMARIAATLPDPLAVDFVETALSALSAEGTERPLLGVMMMTKAGGVEALLRLLDCWCELPHFSVREAHVAMVAALPPGPRLALCTTLAERAAAMADGPEEQHERAYVLGSLAAKAFPRDAEMERLFVQVLRIPRPEEHGYHRLGRTLAEPLADATSLPPAMLSQIFEAFLAGCPGSFCHLKDVATARLQKLPPAELRAYAERAALSADDDSAVWGLQMLLGAAYDPARDPPKPVLAARLCEDPRRRVLLGGQYTTRGMIVPHLRAALRRGEADLATALAAVETAGALWGDVIDYIHGRSHERDAASVEASRRKSRDELGELLGPPELQGPVTEEEWTMLRAARARHPRWTGRDVHCAMGVLPPGPWHPEDRALLDRAVRTAEEDHDLARSIAPLLCEKPEEALLPLFERLEELCDDLEDQHDVARLRRAARERLGLEAQEDEDEDDEDDEDGDDDGEWMDEPEE